MLHLGGKCGIIRDEGYAPDLFTVQGNAAIKSKSVRPGLLSVFVPGGHREILGGSGAPVLRKDVSSSVVNASGEDVVLDPQCRQKVQGRVSIVERQGSCRIQT